jgi:hypothetical protein
MKWEIKRKGGGGAGENQVQIQIKVTGRHQSACYNSTRKQSHNQVSTQEKSKIWLRGCFF